MDNKLINQVIEQLNTLPKNMQRQVLEYVTTLRLSAQRGVPGSRLLRFAGAISVNDLETMRQAIEQGCEQVDKNEW